MKNYFNGFASECITIPCKSTVKKGDPISLDNSSNAFTGYDGTEFMGVCHQVRDNYASVALKGYAELKYEGEAPIIGFNKLVCGAGGTVKVDNNVGRSVMVVAVDTAEKLVGVIL